MPSLKDIKRKVGAVQKTKQITRAMNMVAASKFKSAQLKMENFRPYAGKFMDVLNSLALRVASQAGTPSESSVITAARHAAKYPSTLSRKRVPTTR